MTHQRKTHPVMKVIGIGLLCLGGYAYLHPVPSTESANSPASDDTSGGSVTPLSPAYESTHATASAGTSSTARSVNTSTPDLSRQPINGLFDLIGMQNAIAIHVGSAIQNGLDMVHGATVSCYQGITPADAMLSVSEQATGCNYIDITGQVLSNMDANVADRSDPFFSKAASSERIKQSLQQYAGVRPSQVDDVYYYLYRTMEPMIRQSYISQSQRR